MQTGTANVAGTVIDEVTGQDVTAIITGPACGPNDCGDFHIYITDTLRGVSRLVMHKDSPGLKFEPRADPAAVLEVHTAEADAARTARATAQRDNANAEARESPTLELYRRVLASLPEQRHPLIGWFGGQYGAGGGKGFTI